MHSHRPSGSCPYCGDTGSVRVHSHEDYGVSPGDYVLVRRRVFERIAQAFDYINDVLTEYGSEPKNRRQQRLIFARSEARDALAVVREMADSEHTTAIHTNEGQVSARKLGSSPDNPSSVGRVASDGDCDAR